jgi:HK97 family phage portal protein
LPAVTRCTAIIADTLAGVPWHVYRDRDRLPAPDWVSDPQARRVDQRIVAGPVPDTRLSAVEFWSAVVTSILWWGEGMVYVPTRDAAGAPVPPVWQLNPSDVDVLDGRWVLRGDDDDDPVYEFAPGELIVIRGLTRPGRVRGLGVLQAHAADLGLASAVRDFAANMLSRGIPNGYLKVNAPKLTVEQARGLQQTWMRQHGGPVKKIAVLNATTEFHPLSLDPQAMQLVEMRRYSILEIALLFGVPPYLLGLPSDSSTYANVESRMIELGQFTLFPWARRIESALDAEFPRGTELKLNLDALRRADTATRYQAHKIGLEAGFLTVDEVRQMEDLPRLADVGVVV